VYRSTGCSQSERHPITLRRSKIWIILYMIHKIRNVLRIDRTRVRGLRAKSTKAEVFVKWYIRFNFGVSKSNSVQLYANDAHSTRLPVSSRGMNAGGKCKKHSSLCLASSVFSFTSVSILSLLSLNFIPFPVGGVTGVA